MVISILRTWPFASGNVRELRGYVFHAFYHSGGAVIGPSDLPLEEMVEIDRLDSGQAVSAFDLETLLALPFKQAKQVLLSEFERRYVERHYRQAGYHIGRAARAMGLSERYVSDKLNEYHIHKPRNS
jgi:DNA-binding NtrC family response regulator